MEASWGFRRSATFWRGHAPRYAMSTRRPRKRLHPQSEQPRFDQREVVQASSIDRSWDRLSAAMQHVYGTTPLLELGEFSP